MASISLLLNTPKMITQTALNQLIQNLEEGTESLLGTIIDTVYTPILTTLIQTKFPALQAHIPEIIADVFEKFKDDLLEKTISVDEIATLLEDKTIAECRIAQPKEKELQRNLGMTKSEFEQLVAALQADNQDLFERIYLAHFKNCRRYLKNRCGAKLEEAHESTMNALIEIRKDLYRGKIKYGNLAFYITRRARMKLYKLKNKKSNSMKMTSIDDFISTRTQNVHRVFEIRDLVKKTFDLLGKACKEKLELKFGLGMTYPEMIQLYFPNILENTLTQQTKRCRDKFKHIIENL